MQTAVEKVGIRIAVSRDYRWIVKCDAAEREGWRLPHVQQFLQCGDSVLTVAESSGAVVGYAAYTQHKQFVAPPGLVPLSGVIVLHRVCVHPLWRRLGVGRQLLERAVGAVERRRFGSFLVQLPLLSENVGAARFMSSVLGCRWRHAVSQDGAEYAEWWCQRRITL